MVEQTLLVLNITRRTCIIDVIVSPKITCTNFWIMAPCILIIAWGHSETTNMCNTDYLERSHHPDVQESQGPNVETKP